MLLAAWSVIVHPEIDAVGSYLKNPPKTEFKNSSNWLIVLVPATVWQILNVKQRRQPETEVMWIRRNSWNVRLLEVQRQGSHGQRRRLCLHDRVYRRRVYGFSNTPDHGRSLAGQSGPKIQQTKILVTCQRFGDLFLFGRVWHYSSVQTKYDKGRFKVMATYWQQ